MNKLGASLIGSLLFAGALALTGCNSDTGTAGSGNVLGSSTTGPGTGPGSGAVPGPTGTRVQIIPSSPQMPSSGATTVDLTAIALDAGGQALAGVTITLSTGTDPSAFISNISGGGVSDANGTVTAKLNLGFNRANRLITVSASAQGATANANVDVTGTAITVSGSSSLAFGAQTTLTFSLKDSAGVALPGFAMTLASAAGNGISPATGTTNSAGQVIAVVTANVGGSDTITATAAGASKTQSLTVSGAGFAFTTPAPSVDIPLNTATPVVVHWTASGAPVVGQTVSFSTSRGNLVGNPAITDGAGNASVSISSPFAGPATITASGPSNTPSATLNVVFVATTATSIAVQAVPSTVQVTTGVPSQTNNSSTISVVVRDAQNNLVKNASVTFTLTADPSGGGLTTSTATTDVTGSASVTYIAGSVSSPQNGVTISATVSQVGGVAIPPVTNGTALTVSGQSLLVRLGTDNLVQSVPPLLKKTWAAFVTDAAGNAVVGATVRFALRPGRFEKGFYFVPAPPAAQRWTQAVTAICPNEDLNFNGIVDPGEDTNGNGSLEPPGVTTVNATATTDSTGVALAVLTYPKDHATWTEVILEARSGVAGNDPPATATFFLPGLASDYIDVSVSPPGQLSPYGQNNNCASPL
ncbi:MAG TPA: Ig-like domain-containing protein [Burkholderiales bacterium]|nr:Ig-like domain-containing protein [Burkholderiales bacterium]